MNEFVQIHVTLMNLHEWCTLLGLNLKSACKPSGPKFL